MKRILMVGNHLLDGNQNVWQELATKLKGHGFYVLITSAKLKKIPRLVDIIKESSQAKIDLAIIDVFSGQAFFWASTSGLILYRRKIPYILNLHGGRLAEFAPRAKWFFILLLGKARVVQTPSIFLQKELSPKFGLIHYFPNGLDLGKYHYHHRKMGGKRLIWLRSIHSIYAPWIAVESVKILRDDGLDVLLEMVGPDKHDGSMKRVRSLIHAYGLDEVVKLTGGIPKGEVPEKLSEGDLFLNTTLFESFGVSVMEAAACGLPIVTTNVGELKFMWEDGVDALLVPPNDAQAMADAVKRLLTEPGLAEKLSTNARMKAESFDWSVVLPQWVSLLENI